MCNTCVTSKKCKTCGEIKVLEDFTVVKAGKYGRAARCKKCLNAAARKRRYDCICETEHCKQPFEGTRKDVRFCPECRLRDKTQEEIDSPTKKCKVCKEVKDKSEFYEHSGTLDGRDSECKICANKATKARTYDCVCKNEDCKKPFRGGQKTVKYCEDCRPRRRTQAEIELSIKRCSTCKETKDENEFHKSKDSNDGLTGICKECIRKWQQNRKVEVTCRNPNCNATFISKWKETQYCSNCRPGFEGSCRINFLLGEGNGLGKLYLLNCWGNGEEFYKIGITSKTVEERYGHDGTGSNAGMPYFYRICWIEEFSPKETKALETFYKHRIGLRSYTPELWPRKKSSECFVCSFGDEMLERPSQKIQLSEILNSVKTEVL